jgi:hypothetical protein
VLTGCCGATVLDGLLPSSLGRHKPQDDGLVVRYPELEPALGRPASALIEVAIGGIERKRIVGSVELDVSAAQAHELVDLLAQDPGDVGQEALQGWIGAA